MIFIKKPVNSDVFEQKYLEDIFNGYIYTAISRAENIN